MVVLFFKCTVESGICKFLLNLDFDHSMERLQGSQHSQKYRGNPDFSNHPGKKQIWRIECKITVFVWWRVRFELPEISKTRGFKKSGVCCKWHCTFHHTAHKQLSANGRTGTFGLGGGGEGRWGGSFLPVKNTQCPNSWVCNRDTKALILCKKEKRLQFSCLVKPF